MHYTELSLADLLALDTNTFVRISNSHPCFIDESERQKIKLEISLRMHQINFSDKNQNEAPVVVPIDQVKEFKVSKEDFQWLQMNRQINK